MIQHSKSVEISIFQLFKIWKCCSQHVHVFESELSWLIMSSFQKKAYYEAELLRANVFKLFRRFSECFVHWISSEIFSSMKLFRKKSSFWKTLLPYHFSQMFSWLSHFNTRAWNCWMVYLRSSNVNSLSFCFWKYWPCDP